MRFAVLVLTGVLFSPMPISAQDAGAMHDHHRMDMAMPDDPPIKITINPEARVSVVLAGSLPAPAACGKAIDLPVKIVNQGFVTTSLEARVVGDAVAGITLDFPSEPLKGVPEESRTLRITLSHPGTTDITISFKAHNDIPELGGRDQVHFLMRCLKH